MDAFSEILNAVKLQGAVFFNAEFSAPWAFQAPRSEDVAPALLPGAEHLVIFHLLIDGSAYAQVEGGRPVPLTAGDIIILPHGDAHRMGNGTPSQLLDHSRIMSVVRCRTLEPMRTGGNGDVTRFVCGYMACDPQLCRPIMAGLPPIMNLNIRSAEPGHWLGDAIRRLVQEGLSDNPGSEALLAKLSEALFVEALRLYVARLPENETGWLAGARDAVVGKSLSLLHNRVTHPWTIAELAKEAGVSRSALVERFSRYLSEPPMAYLMHWRLQLAARKLTSTPHSVAEIAGEVGYDSEAAFSRAFKREFGAPPAAFRRSREKRQAGATSVGA